VLFYRAAVDLPRSTPNYVSELILRHRRAIGSARRLLNPGRQALLVLVRASGRTPSSRAGASSESSGAALARPVTRARPSPFSRTTGSPKDEKTSMNHDIDRALRPLPVSPAEVRPISRRSAAKPACVPGRCRSTAFKPRRWSAGQRYS
jgi:hypothetical protein